LRFEDYVYRLWIQQDGIVTAHTDAAQTHVKNNYMRNPLTTDVFNEELCRLLKKKIKSSLASVDDLSIRFDYEGEVTLQDSDEILETDRRGTRPCPPSGGDYENPGTQPGASSVCGNLGAFILRF
jgi:hypothetical protein